ncbi:MAG: trans-sulfuration enzyme family protein [Bacteriovoracaceae bacterium]
MQTTEFSTNFYFKDVASFREAVVIEDEIAVYSRGANPTVEEFNQYLAPMEGKEAALSFASGMAAISAVLFTYLKAGDHVITHRHIYSWAKKLIHNRLPHLGIEVTMLDESELPNLAKYIKPNTKMVYLENPTFFFFEEIPLRQILKITKEKNILTAMDNTYLGPRNLSPDILSQIDFIIHSTTKIISGHSDAMGGAVCTTKAHRKEIFEHGLMTLGGIMSPMNAILSLRGLKSYDARINWIKTQTMEFVQFLRQHPAIAKVNYPWETEHHPDYNFPVGLFSFTMKNKSPTATEQFCKKMKVFKIAVSYGGVDAYLIPTLAFAESEQAVKNDLGLMRVAVGLQSATMLIADFNQALS